MRDEAPGEVGDEVGVVLEVLVLVDAPEDMGMRKGKRGGELKAGVEQKDWRRAPLDFARKTSTSGKKSNPFTERPDVATATRHPQTRYKKHSLILTRRSTQNDNSWSQPGVTAAAHFRYSAASLLSNYWAEVPRLLITTCLLHIYPSLLHFVFL